MKSIIPFATIAIILLFSCGNEPNKELELLKEQIAKQEQKITALEDALAEDAKVSQQNEIAVKRELRYLFYANGGMAGYFDDGSVVGCPKCDFISSNILTMFDGESIGEYTVQNDGSLLLSDGEVLIPTISENSFDNWPLIDYEWNEKVPQE